MLFTRNPQQNFSWWEIVESHQNLYFKYICKWDFWQKYEILLTIWERWEILFGAAVDYSSLCLPKFFEWWLLTRLAKAEVPSASADSLMRRRSLRRWLILALNQQFLTIFSDRPDDLFYINKGFRIDFTTVKGDFHYRRIKYSGISSAYPNALFG